MNTEEFRDKFKSQIEYINNLEDDNIDCSDIPEIDDFSNFKPNHLFKPKKGSLTLRMDLDVRSWIKSQPNYSKYITELCRTDMNKKLAK